jgi:quercetin dioxygenase-like cupin family protein
LPEPLSNQNEGAECALAPILKEFVMRMATALGLAAVAALALWGAAQADDEKGHAEDKGHVMVRPDDINWGPAPPSLPAGAQIAVLSGDPGKAGSYVLRAKLPDGYKIPPHWHPTDENVTVLKGTFVAGKGEKFDADAGHDLAAGSFVCMPKGMRHFAWCKGETILQIHGVGPFEIYYVNAADDPRTK